MRERLQKIISSAGVASRRRAEELIRAGKVSVNGLTAELGMSADPQIDEITIDGRTLQCSSQLVYIMLNKPPGYVTTLRDEKGRRTVADLVRDVGVRLYPVGRLDMYSEGLLIMTNDGNCAHQLMHPAHHVPKTYWVVPDRPCAEEDLIRLRRPFYLDGWRVQALDVKWADRNEKIKGILITIGEGRNRQIRRMCQASGIKIRRLRRIAQGDLCLGDLPQGKWRYLTESEIHYLYNLTQCPEAPSNKNAGNNV